ncbi:MAG: addiction module toxin RelE [Candidatus Diapherotrites archaeon]
MPFKYDFGEELEETLAKLFKKGKKRYEIVLKKVEEIASRDEDSIEYYKNLKHDYKEYKRVHIDKSFVLLFRVFKKEKFIIFDKLKHHDGIYRR